MERAALLSLRFAISSFRYQLHDCLYLSLNTLSRCLDAVNPKACTSAILTKRGRNLTSGIGTNTLDPFVKHYTLSDKFLNIFRCTPATRRRQLLAWTFGTSFARRSCSCHKGGHKSRRDLLEKAQRAQVEGSNRSHCRCCPCLACYRAYILTRDQAPRRIGELCLGCRS